jgi:mannose-6-phosphate isomerase-like protein (cupin superfamily)
MSAQPKVAGPSSRDTAPSYIWGPGCRGWHFVQTPELSIIHEQMPPGTQEVRHRHHVARQFFYVLTGVLVMECDGVRHLLKPGLGLEIAPMTPHQARNESSESIEFLVISQPASHGDREVLE